MAAQKKAKFGSVKEISAVDYVDEVNKAGDGVWVILHLYQSGYVQVLQEWVCSGAKVGMKRSVIWKYRSSGAKTHNEVVHK